MWPWTSHVPLKVSPVCPSAEWGSISHLLPRSVSLQHLHAFQLGAGITWSLCTRSSQRQDSIQGWPSTEWGRNCPGWALGPRKRHPLPAYFETRPQWRTERKIRRSPSLIPERTQLSGPFFPLRFWDSFSNAPSQLLWVAEPIMAPCILIFYSHNLGSFSPFWGGWTLSLHLTSR